MNQQELFHELKPGDVVVIIKESDDINAFHDYKIGEKLIFNDIITFESNPVKFRVNLIRKEGSENIMAHFSEDIAEYIESVSKVRDIKLNNILNG